MLFVVCVCVCVCVCERSNCFLCHDDVQTIRLLLDIDGDDDVVFIVALVMMMISCGYGDDGDMMVVLLVMIVGCLLYPPDMNRDVIHVREMLK